MSVDSDAVRSVGSLQYRGLLDEEYRLIASRFQAGCGRGG